MVAGVGISWEILKIQIHKWSVAIEQLMGAEVYSWPLFYPSFFLTDNIKNEINSQGDQLW